MRSRRLFTFAALSAAALALAGCSAAAPETVATPSASAAAVSLCDMVYPEGPSSKAVKVSGAFDETPKVSFDGDPVSTDMQRTVSVKGDGPAITDGEYVTFAMSLYDAETGELKQQQGRGDIGPMTLRMNSKVSSTGYESVFGCATKGSRITVTAPADATQGTAAAVFVFDVLDVTPATEWCLVSDDKATMPTATIADGADPKVSIPKDATPPSDVHLEVLTEGDGKTVAEGDQVSVRYTGVRWSNGAVFDTSWTAAEPVTFSTDGVVVGFKRALEGQKVGTTLIATMSPACGYGDGKLDNSGQTLVGETLVFVIKIEGTAPAAKK